MQLEEKLVNAAEDIEKLITIDFRARGMIRPILKMIRKNHQIPPLLTAAKSLNDISKPNDYVFIVTGLNSRGVSAETDGPVGAAFLGRSLALGLGLRPIFLINRDFRSIMFQTARAAGLNIFDLDFFHRYKDKVICSSSVLDFSLEEKKAKEEAIRLLDDFKPISIISVETRGMNALGICHTWDGENVSQNEPKFNRLFSEAKKREILSIGIFDGCCTEIGYSSIRNEIKQNFSFLNKCKCGCGGGIIDDTWVDIPISAAVSNWGAYGIAACLAILLGNEAILHDKDLERRAIRECADAGAIEGTIGIPVPSVDGLSADFHGKMIDLLGTLIKSNIKGFKGGHQELVE